MNKPYNHGAVLKLTREDTLETIEMNFKQMTECGLNTVVVWPAAFWWEEKKEGYPFNTGKELLKLAEKYDLQIVMELAGQLTVMEYIPDFLMKPEYFAVDDNGHKILGQTSFGFLNYFHPEVKALICEHYKKAAEAYKDYPALIGYDVFNETMFRSTDEYTWEEFRSWLKEKYGTIEKLNDVWERTYTDFSQINNDVYWMWMSVMPSADYAIFRRESVARFLKPWCDAILSVDDKHPLIADNIHSQVAPTCMYERPHGDYSLQTVADIIGMSFYPKQQGGTMATPVRWEVFDAYASAAGRRGFWISEMQTHIQALYNPGTCVLPSELKHWCYEAYAAGAKGLVYWMWRPFTKGLQTLGRGLVNYRNQPTERFELVNNISKDLYKYGALTPVRSNVGVLYSERSDDYSRRYTFSYSVDKDHYSRGVAGAYKVLHNLNVRADIMTIDEINNYKAVVLSNACALSEEETRIIRDYVAGGGVIISDGKLAVVDEWSMQYEYIPGGGLHEVAGEIYFETDNRDNSFEAYGKKVDGYWGRDQFELAGADVLATFSDGKAAVTRNKFGKGEFISVNTSIFYGYYMKEFESVKDYVGSLVDEYSLRQLTASDSLRVRISENDECYLVFAFNYTNEEVTSDVTVNIDGVNTTVNVTVGAQDVKLVEIKK